MPMRIYFTLYLGFLTGLGKPASTPCAITSTAQQTAEFVPIIIKAIQDSVPMCKAFVGCVHCSVAKAFYHDSIAFRQQWLLQV